MVRGLCVPALGDVPKLADRRRATQRKITQHPSKVVVHKIRPGVCILGVNCAVALERVPVHAVILGEVSAQRADESDGCTDVAHELVVVNSPPLHHVEHYPVRTASAEVVVVNEYALKTVLGQYTIIPAADDVIVVDVHALGVLDQDALTVGKPVVEPFPAIVGLVDVVVVNLNVLHISVARRTAGDLDLNIVVRQQIAADQNAPDHTIRVHVGAVHPYTDTEARILGAENVVVVDLHVAGACQDVDGIAANVAAGDDGVTRRRQQAQAN